MNKKSKFSSESVTEGHPDKVCDTISDAILDAHLSQDPFASINCEVAAKSDSVFILGELSSSAQVDIETVTREAVRKIGYIYDDDIFHADKIKIQTVLTEQREKPVRTNSIGKGAVDQGMMFGFATKETPEKMPLPISLAHRLSRYLADDRKSLKVPFLKPDGKTQVTVEYENFKPIRVTDVVVSAHHNKGVMKDEILTYVEKLLIPRALQEWYHSEIVLHINKSSPFHFGGPMNDAGLTGRKIVVDTYGGMANHGGGAFSGKDPYKVDRSGAYFARFVALAVVEHGLAERVEIQVCYGKGQAEPLSLSANSFGSGKDAQIEDFIKRYDFRPGAIIERLDLLKPIYSLTTNYGHFGKSYLPWEKTDFN